MRIVFTFIIGTTLAACSPPSADQIQQRPDLTGTSATIARPPVASENVTASLVTRADFKKRHLDWPLTVEAGELGCTDQARWVKVRGVRYGLNGTASVGRGFPPLDPIWQDDKKMAEDLKAIGAPNEPPIKMNVGDMIAEAGKFC